MQICKNEAGPGHYFLQCYEKRGACTQMSAARRRSDFCNLYTNEIVSGPFIDRKVFTPILKGSVLPLNVFFPRFRRNVIKDGLTDFYRLLSKETRNRIRF